MKLIDKYIFKQFTTSFVFSLIGMIAIFVVSNMMENLDDFIDANVQTQIIFEYYVAFIPEIIKFMTPVAVLIATLFITGRLSAQNELAAIKSTGTSLTRIMLPFMLVAIFITAVSVLFNGWVVPYANQKKFYIERNYLHRLDDIKDRYNIIFQDGKNRIVSIGYYDAQAKIARKVSIQDFDNNDFTILRSRYDSYSMNWVSNDNKEQGIWKLHSGTVRNFYNSNQTLQYFDSLEIGKLTITPAEIEKKQLTPDEMNYPELYEFIENQKKAGQDIARWVVEYHFKYAFPFASIIMVLFGVPFASSRPRTGAALGFGIALAVSFIYLIFMKASQVFGYNGDLNPIFTAWLANIVFLVAGIINLIRIPK